RGLGSRAAPTGRWRLGRTRRGTGPRGGRGTLSGEGTAPPRPGALEFGGGGGPRGGRVCRRGGGGPPTPPEGAGSTRTGSGGLDAVVIRVPNDAAEPPPAVAARHAERGPMRLYPVEGAHLVKWPHTGGPTPEGCTVEPGGWDHEHCDGCNRHINVGRTFWQTA